MPQRDDLVEEHGEREAVDSLRVGLLAVVLEYLGRHEARRAGEALRASRQDAPADRVVGQLEVHVARTGARRPTLAAVRSFVVVVERKRVGRELLAAAAARLGKLPHEHVVGLQIAIDDSIRMLKLATAAK